jgi:hypothetical protein
MQLPPHVPRFQTGNPRPAEEINTKSLDKGLNRLYNSGDLQDAFGQDNANKLLDHSGSATQQIADIKRGRIEQAANRNAFRQNVIRPAVRTVATGLGIGAAAEVVSAVRKALGGEK